MNPHADGDEFERDRLGFPPFAQCCLTSFHSYSKTEREYMYWREIAQWLGLRPHDHILADESLPEYERRMKHAKLVAHDKEALRASKQSTLGTSYRPLSLWSRLYLRNYFAKQSFQRSLPGQFFLAVATRFWLFRLWLSKQIQYHKFVSPTGGRKSTLVFLFSTSYSVLGLLLGDQKSYFEFLPGHPSYGTVLMTHHRYHWITGYVLENTYYKHKPEIYNKDNLAQGVDRIMKEGLEMKEMDSLNWLMLGSLLAAQQQQEFSYLAMQMAHYKNHRVIGGNSLQPIEAQDAMKFFGK